MTRSRRRAAVVLGVGLLASGVSACGGSNDQPTTQETVAGTSSTSASPSGSAATEAVCADADALGASMDRLKSAEAGQNALSVLTTELATMKIELQQLVADAKDAFGPQVDTVKSKAAALKADLQAATESPSPATMSGVTGGVRALGIAVDDLVRSVADAC